MAAAPVPLERQQAAISLLRLKGQDLRLQEVAGRMQTRLELRHPTAEEIACTVDLPQLVDLKIYHANFTRHDIAQLQQLKHVQRLTLSHCRFDKGNVAFLRHMKSLERFYLMHCHLEGASLSELGDLSDLYYVRISDCVLEDGGNLVFPHEMQQLARVYVYDTYVNEWSFRNLVSSPYLMSLKFQNAQVTDDYLQGLEPGPRVQRLRVYDGISNEAGERFRSQFPHVRFYW